VNGKLALGKRWTWKEVGGGETISSAGRAQAFGRAVHAISSRVLVCFKVVHEKALPEVALIALLLITWIESATHLVC
jgi:hypothetical protein